jgi:ribonuclease Z
MIKKLLIGILGLALIAGIGLHFFGDQLLRGVMKRQAMAALAGEGLAKMAGGLNVALCGAGAPLPDPGRAGPCVLVQAGETLLVVDVGSGSPRNLGPMQVPAGAIDALLLTHFHSDHIDGLGELMLQRWAGGGRDAPLPVIAPEGVTPIVDGFNAAYAHDFGYRVAHHGTAVVPPSGAGATAQPFAMPEAAGREVYAADGLRVTAFSVSHHPVEPAVGYRFDYRGRSVVISGDTTASPTVAAFAEGVDVLLHEALHPGLVGVLTEAAEAAGNARFATITRDILDYHTSPVEAATIAQQAGVGALVYYHIVPQLPSRLLHGLFLEGVTDAYDGRVEIGYDGLWVHLPADDDSIRFDSLMAF